MIRRRLLLLGILILLGFAVYRLMFVTASIAFTLTDPDGDSRSQRVSTNSSLITVNVFQVNRLGFRVPFSHLDGKFIVREGAEKIENVQEKKDQFAFKTRNNIGTLVILYYARGVPFPIEIVLDIEGASLAGNNEVAFAFC